MAVDPEPPERDEKRQEAISDILRLLDVDDPNMSWEDAIKLARDRGIIVVEVED